MRREDLDQLREAELKRLASEKKFARRLSLTYAVTGACLGTLLLYIVTLAEIVRASDYFNYFFQRVDTELFLAASAPGWIGGGVVGTLLAWYILYSQENSHRLSRLFIFSVAFGLLLPFAVGLLIPVGDLVYIYVAGNGAWGTFPNALLEESVRSPLTGYIYGVNNLYVGFGSGAALFVAAVVGAATFKNSRVPFYGYVVTVLISVTYLLVAFWGPSSIIQFLVETLGRVDI